MSPVPIGLRHFAVLCIPTEVDRPVPVLRKVTSSVFGVADIEKQGEARMQGRASTSSSSSSSSGSSTNNNSSSRGDSLTDNITSKESETGTGVSTCPCETEQSPETCAKETDKVAVVAPYLPVPDIQVSPMARTA